jgi:hypothetical protein
MLKFVCFAGAILLCSSAFAPQRSFGQEGFNLAPGEKVIAINGVPFQSAMTTSQPSSCANGNCAANVGGVTSTVPAAVTTRGGRSPIIGEGTAAYQHALREAQIIAARGGNYHRHSDGGHPLGNAPGCKYSGTGYTWDMNRPGHCWEDELPESRIVARARAQGANGAWFWSAHYR